MPLGKNIAGVIQSEYGVTPTDTELLLAAYSRGNVGVQAAPSLSIPVTQVQTNYPVSGGNVDGASSGSGATANVAVVSEDGVNSPASPAAGAAAVPLLGKVSPLVVAGLGLGALLLFGGKQKSVGAKKKSLLLPVLVAGGLAWWFFIRGNGANNAAADAQMKADLQTQYAGQVKQLALINSADAETIRRWWDLVQMWNKGMSAAEIYAIGVDGSSPATWENSIGAWWEQFAKSNGI
jgi:hypothetical protein